ncbi:hypothetical protein [Clostridioides difficile]|nr:hypothetical protein [Clostridioides difficile]
MIAFDLADVNLKRRNSILKIDHSKIELKGISLITPVTITNHSNHNMNT